MFRSYVFTICLFVLLSEFGCILCSSVPVSEPLVSIARVANGDGASEAIDGTSSVVTTTVGLFGAVGITSRENLQRQLLDLSLSPSTPSSLIMNTEESLERAR